MERKIGLILLTALMMFPQFVETIYSPALPQIAEGFSVNAAQASQTLSLYFFAFAFGIVFWGRCCDTLGRRPTILAGLLIYGIASIIALFVNKFELLLIARMLAAFGAAVGSVGTQTMIRDSYRGKALARVFSFMGMALAISPTIGLLTGATLVHFWGYEGVFVGLLLIAVFLVGWSTLSLPETRSNSVNTAPLIKTLLTMLTDREIWNTAFLVALFNISLFSYYQLAPFTFKKLGLSQEVFGYSGFVVAHSSYRFREV